MKYHQLSQIGQIRLNHNWNEAAFMMSGYIGNLLTQNEQVKAKIFMSGPQQVFVTHHEQTLHEQVRKDWNKIIMNRVRI